MGGWFPKRFTTPSTIPLRMSVCARIFGTRRQAVMDNSENGLEIPSMVDLSEFHAEDRDAVRANGTSNRAR